MDLRNDIKKATSLTFIDDDAKFYRLHGLSQAAKDRKMNERTMRKPRNLYLLEDSDIKSENCTNVNSKVKPTFDKYEVSAAVREVNGGRDLSNKHWEENFLRNLNDMMQSKKEVSRNSSKYDNARANQSATKDLNDKYIKQKAKLCRNAAIMGLVKIKKISMQDLVSSSNENSTRKKDEPETLHRTTFNGCTTDDDKYHVESIPLREDPEIYVHPLQIGIDKKQFKDINFSVSRIGTKTKTTPAGYFLGATDDAFFNFVKKKDST